ncbi:MAG: hypothetical protein PSX80_05345 [bacterium]|nr:hypothetical protein [bacterium]
MNRTYTSIAVLAMVLVAVGVCLAYTIEFRERLSTLTIAIVFTAEGIVAGVAIASGLSLLRRRYAMREKPVNPRPVGAAVQA